MNVTALLPGTCAMRCGSESFKEALTWKALISCWEHKADRNYWQQTSHWEALIDTLLGGTLQASVTWHLLPKEDKLGKASVKAFI